MTHMFIATTLWGRQLKVDTYKFVLKNDRVGLCYAGVAKANQDDISKLMDPFLVVEDLPMNEDFETSEQTVPFVAYMPEVFSAHAEVVPLIEFEVIDPVCILRARGGSSIRAGRVP